MPLAAAFADHAVLAPTGGCRRTVEKTGAKVQPVAAAAERDRAGQLYVRYGGQVHARCRYLLGDTAEAEDAMQEVFARALCNLDGFRAESSPLTWLLKIATHHCLNLLRANRALWRDEVRKLAMLRPAADPTGDARPLVRALLSRFDPQTQACAIHYLVDEMSQEEVAQVVGLSVPTVRKRVRAFLAAARAQLDLPDAPEEKP